jgi:hypothetical protein
VMAPLPQRQAAQGGANGVPAPESVDVRAVPGPDMVETERDVSALKNYYAQRRREQTAVGPVPLEESSRV